MCSLIFTLLGAADMYQYSYNMDRNNIFIRLVMASPAPRAYLARVSQALGRYLRFAQLKHVKAIVSLQRALFAFLNIRKYTHQEKGRGKGFKNKEEAHNNPTGKTFYVCTRLKGFNPKASECLTVPPPAQRECLPRLNLPGSDAYQWAN